MRISNAMYKTVKIDWDNVSVPLKEGTPIAVDGTEANTADAVGIVPQTIKERPLMDSIQILVGGDVELKDCEKGYGASYSKECKAALKGLRIWKEDYTIDAGDDPAPTPTEPSLVVTVTDDDRQDTMRITKEEDQDPENPFIQYFLTGTLHGETDGENSTYRLTVDTSSSTVGEGNVIKYFLENVGTDQWEEPDTDGKIIVTFTLDSAEANVNSALNVGIFDSDKLPEEPTPQDVVDALIDGKWFDLYSLDLDAGQV